MGAAGSCPTAASGSWRAAGTGSSRPAGSCSRPTGDPWPMQGQSCQVGDAFRTLDKPTAFHEPKCETFLRKPPYPPTGRSFLARHTQILAS